jgi:hypothetical protein
VDTCKAGTLIKSQSRVIFRPYFEKDMLYPGLQQPAFKYPQERSTDSQTPAFTLDPDLEHFSLVAAISGTAPANQPLIDPSHQSAASLLAKLSKDR